MNITEDTPEVIREIISVLDKYGWSTTRYSVGVPTVRFNSTTRSVLKCVDACRDLTFNLRAKDGDITKGI